MSREHILENTPRVLPGSHLLKKQAFGELKNLIYNQTAPPPLQWSNKNAKNFYMTSRSKIREPLQDELKFGKAAVGRKIELSSLLDSFFSLRDFAGECCNCCCLKSEEEIWTNFNKIDTIALENVIDQIFDSNFLQWDEKNVTEFDEYDDDMDDIVSILIKPLLYFDNYTSAEYEY